MWSKQTAGARKKFCRPPISPPAVQQLYNRAHPAASFRIFFFLSSLALFAFWLRSSVVSVLFSLISERSLLRPIKIILIFGFRMVSSVLAHDSIHSVPGITLPPGDANLIFFFSLLAWACLRGEEETTVDDDSKSKKVKARNC